LRRLSGSKIWLSRSPVVASLTTHTLNIVIGPLASVSVPP
jgi:hypothetical protein